MECFPLPISKGMKFPEKEFSQRIISTVFQPIDDVGNHSHVSCLMRDVSVVTFFLGHKLDYFFLDSRLFHFLDIYAKN